MTLAFQYRNGQLTKDCFVRTVCIMFEGICLEGAGNLVQESQ